MATEEDARRRERLADLVCEYVDRINAGETLDEARIQAEQPDLAQDLLRELKTFLRLGSRTVKNGGPIGSLGDYRLVREVGRGGMGVVYEAWQGSMDRRVALKVLPAGFAADQKTFLRFMREARIAGKLHHQNVVPVYGMGVEADTPYYSMEFIEGETLAQVLARRPQAGDLPSPEECYRIAGEFAEVAEGLQHAHSMGVIHRDLKPSNLIRDGDGRLRILDFGLARLETEATLTKSGDFLGTPLYMSPEQALAKRIPIDHRTDIYSLGATIYETLAGRPPFEGKDHQDTLSQIIFRDAQRLHRLNPRVPRDLDTIVLKCLRKDPADRYGTAEALAQDLSRFVRADPIEARPQGSWERWWRHARRNRLRILTATALAALVLMGGALALVLWKNERDARWAEYVRAVNRGLVDLELGIMTSAGQAAEGETQALGLLYAGDVRGQADPVHEGLAASLEGIEGAIRLWPERPEAHLVQSRFLWALGRDHEAEAALAQALALDPAFLPAHLYRAQSLRDHGQRDEADCLLRDLDSRVTGGWERTWLDAHQNAVRGEWGALDGIYSRLLETTPVEPFVGFATDLRLKRGRAALKREDYWRAVEDLAHLRDEWRSIGPSLLLGSAYYRMGDRKAAHRALDEALVAHGPAATVAVDAVYNRFGDREKSNETIAGIQDPRIKQVALLGMLSRSGKYQEAVEAGRKAIELGTAGPQVYVGMLWDYGWLQRPSDARAIAEEGLARFPGNRRILTELGWVYHYMAEIERAIECFEQTLPSYRAYQGLGWCYWHLGDLDASDRNLRQSIERYPRLTPAYAGLARNSYYRGDLKGAVAFDAQCNLLDPGFETDGDCLFSIYSPRTLYLYTAHWENLSLAFGSSVERGATRERVLGLSALSALHKKEPDLARALSHAQRAVEATRHFDGLFLAIRGEVQAAQGKTEEAIRALERAIEVPNRRSLAAELLESYRKEFLPKVASATSVDALLADGSDVKTVAGEIGRSSPDLARYLEACFLESAGRPDEAAELLDRLVENRLGEEAVILRLARVRGKLGRRDDAMHLIEERLLSSGQAAVNVWALWLMLGSQEPAIALQELLARAPLREVSEVRDLNFSPLRGDVRWMLTELSKGGELRINCGGETDFVDSRNRTWSRDRCFDGGWGSGGFIHTATIKNAAEPDLYWRRRWWVDSGVYIAPGYHIPIPNGRYEIVLHFCKVVLAPAHREKRTRDVVCEAETLLDDYDPAGGALGVVEKHSFTIEVLDGCLDITFRQFFVADISAIEVRRLP